ncbi:MAG: gliding motility-associated C-terminal domain-containing protein [Flavobacteriales bacterium]|nr:gliding motility-associated C-terminal domain-containing protein [Flavobacteriales bacterium]
MRKVLFFLMLCSAAAVVPEHAWATHNRAGEIIYCQDPDDPLSYFVQIITHTKTSAPADRPELEIFWGDGTSEILPRVSVTLVQNLDAQRNVYDGWHTYSGPGIFTLSFEDPNRNEGVLNIPNSVLETFCVKSQLIISPLTGGNCSVRFLNSPLQDACLQQLWVHNSVAFDPDGDSLSYELTVCSGLNCDPIPGYEFPDEVAAPPNTFSIDPLTGTMVWNTPQLVGEYNIAFIVREWRNGQMIGWVTRDMQITVVPCSNQPPVVAEQQDTCVEAGTFLSFPVFASDPDAGQSVTLTALGSPFVLDDSPATFVSPIPGNPVNGIFNWSTVCEHVRLQPYQVVFRATDNGQPVNLEDYESMNITIVAPAPENPSATASGNVIELQWDASVCSNAVGYKIYRRSGLYGFVPGPCETGVPGYTGYVQVGSTSGLNATSFTDAQNLVFGNEYCYMVVACFEDGAQSYASVEFCAILDRQVPVITHNSVGVTDPVNGVDTVRWSNAWDLDTIARPGPYRFVLFRGSGFNVANTPIWTSSDHPFLQHPDTVFIDQGLDTESGPHTYRVLFLGSAGTDTIGSSNVASSVFITGVPNDEQITVEIAQNTPWINTEYEVFRFDGTEFVPIGITNTTSYVDTGLVNGQEYCYLVKSTGAYSDPDVVSPLINFSQETCAIPVDLTPPCPPTLDIDNDCEVPLNFLTWTNPNSTCADDTWMYHIWFTDSLGGDPAIIATITGATDTTFQHVDGTSVAGCYYVTAIDSVGNESAFSNEVCGDNCPEYELPNIFTPNSDGRNDTFRPFPYRGVKVIDLQVFNRWGQVIFTSTDPDIGWDGTHQSANEPVPEGVYFYTCVVTYARLAGPEQVLLKGYVHLIRSSVSTVN